MSVIREISERKKAEKALKESEDRLRFIFENANDALFTLNSQGNFFYISPAVEKLLGYLPAELFGDKLLKFVFPDDKRDVQKAMELVSSGQQKEVHIEYRVLNKSGDILWHSTSITRNTDASGNNLFVGVSKDITERIKAEQERLKLEEQVRHTQKLESLGVLAGGIAHDFNNLLTAIMGNTGLALMSQNNEQKLKTNLVNIEKASLRAADLCKQLLAYSGKGQFVVEPLNINTIVKEMSDLLSVSISRKITLNYQFVEKLPAFEADSTQIRQIVMNLITNASEAIGDKVGTISIATGITHCDKNSIKEIFSDSDFVPGDYIYLDVTDSGSGMDEETKSKIFDPFFTTKFTGRGLGLAAVLGIVRSHKGGISIMTKLNKGTTFRILFPISDKKYKEEYFEQNDKMDWKGKGTVLVVDDEEDIRNFVCESLEHVGLQVLTAFDGQNAIDVYKQKGESINLILMDMTMPNLNGEETFRELLKLEPDVKVILSSGYSKEKAMEKFNSLSLCGFLQKPYKPNELIKKIQSILGSNGSN